ncbi:MAG: glycoside hydrolase family 5 protein [Armatimonadetes bacterium]|jgi:hypothetical protein|nr:glycoside hydrolase family 5 protein [Armatimonadota bacterium]
MAGSGRIACVLLAVTLAAPGAAGAAAEPPGLSVRADGVLVKEGRPYRGIGVNYFDLFYRTLLKPGDTSYEEGLKALAARKIPFARFMCSGFWPSENRLYQQDKEAYFQRLDAVVRAAEKHGIGLIPSLFWNLSTVPDLVGEPCDQWGNPESKTHAWMRAYTREVVTRYRESPAIWGWEFGNEYNLSADLPNAAEWRPAVHPELGTPASRSRRDELTHDMIRTAFAAFAKTVRQHDPHRIVLTGNAFPRPSAWHQRQEKSWTTDTPEQYREMLLGDNPDPHNTLSVHAYQEDVKRIAATQQIAVAAKKPLFVGEFGVPGARTPAAERQFRELLATIEREGVPLAALWVYDFSGQDADWNVTATNGRAYQLEAVAEANARLRGER